MKTSKIWSSPLLTLHPVDRVAKRVTDQGSEYQFPINTGTMVHSETPLPTKPSKSKRKIVGTKFGRLQVIGLFSLRKSSEGKNLWVVRCACGRYEVRTGKAIFNPKNADDCCHKCRHTEQVKRNQMRREFGQDKQG